MKKTAYILSLVICIGWSSNCTAGTDLLANAMAQANTTLKNAANVQAQVSTELQREMSKKISLDDLLTGKGATLKEKIDRLNEKAESLKEKVEKIQKRVEAAKEYKDAMTEKYGKYLQDALNLLNMAKETYSMGIGIYNQYIVAEEPEDEDKADIGTETPVVDLQKLEEEKQLMEEEFQEGDVEIDNGNLQLGIGATTPVYNQADVIASVTKTMEDNLSEGIAVDQITVPDVKIPTIKDFDTDIVQ